MAYCYSRKHATNALTCADAVAVRAGEGDAPEGFKRRADWAQRCDRGEEHLRGMLYASFAVQAMAERQIALVKDLVMLVPYTTLAHLA